MMNRRLVVRAVAAGSATILFAAQAQVPGRTYRVGYLGLTAYNTPGDEGVVAALVQRLRELGFAEGKNLVIEWRFAEGHIERYADFAREIVKMEADVVVVSSGTAARAVMAASRTLPIVTIAIPDPVKSGLVVSLARPGGQLTGITNLADELVPKRIELLKAAVPAARHIALARCPACSATAGLSAEEIRALQLEREAAARSLGVTLLDVDVNAAEDFVKATETLRRERPDGLLIGATPINTALQREWLAFAAEQRLPMLAPYRGFGAMLSYGPDYAAVFRKAAEYVARILNGTPPADLPMEQPTKFEFVVKLKAAKEIGITIPQAVLLRADSVIQ